MPKRACDGPSGRVTEGSTGPWSVEHDLLS
jgi:hypothetical protein